MKRILNLLLVAALLLLPTASVFAQDDDDMWGGDVPYFCQLEVLLTSWGEQLTQVQSGDDLLMFFEDAATTVFLCGSIWVEALFPDLFGDMTDEPDGFDTMYDPYDGVLSAEEAEYAIVEIFDGNYEEGIQYLCFDEQPESEEEAGVELVSINEVDCMADGDFMVCEIELESFGESESLTATFEVVDGQLCESTSE